MTAALASELPNDVMVDILSWLPVKSLIRFKCVQKSWLALIESPSFITKHCSHAVSRTDSHFLLVKRELKEITTNLATLHPTSTPGDLTNINLPPLYHNQRGVCLSPTCANGIICLRVSDLSIVLWNPAIRDHWVVPENPVSPPTNLDAYLEGIGFGYDAKSDDYKVIRITRFWDDYGVPISYLVEVYSLKQNLWRRVNAVKEGFLCYSRCGEVFLNGIYHWCARALDSDGKGYEFIMGFDISNEIFNNMELPDCLYPYDNMINRCCALLNNSIAMIVYNRVNYGDDESFEIWVMNEYNSKESWEKKFKVGPLSGLSLNSPLGFWNNEKLLLETISGDILKYDLESGEIEILNVNGVPNSIAVLNYTENLIQIKGDN